MVLRHRSERASTFDVVWYGPDGSQLASHSFTDVPDKGTAQLPYNGSESLISCDQPNSATGDPEANVELVNSATGRVDAAHADDD